MKKFKLLAFLALAMCVVSCTKDLEEDLKVEPGAGVELVDGSVSFAVKIPSSKGYQTFIESESVLRYSWEDVNSSDTSKLHLAMGISSNGSSVSFSNNEIYSYVEQTANVGADSALLVSTDLITSDIEAGATISFFGPLNYSEGAFAGFETAEGFEPTVSFPVSFENAAESPLSGIDFRENLLIAGSVTTEVALSASEGNSMGDISLSVIPASLFVELTNAKEEDVDVEKVEFISSAAIFPTELTYHGSTNTYTAGGDMASIVTATTPEVSDSVSYVRVASGETKGFYVYILPYGQSVGDDVNFTVRITYADGSYEDIYSKEDLAAELPDGGYFKQGEAKRFKKTLIDAKDLIYFADFLEEGKYADTLPTADTWYIAEDEFALADTQAVHSALRRAYDADTARRITLDFSESTFTSLQNYCLFDNTSTANTFPVLEALVMPTTLTSVGHSAAGRSIRNLSNLKSVTGLDNVTTINKYCFAGCSSLETLTLPSVTSLDTFTFSGIPLTSLYLTGSEAITLFSPANTTADCDLVLSETYYNDADSLYGIDVANNIWFGHTWKGVYKYGEYTPEEDKDDDGDDDQTPTTPSPAVAANNPILKLGDPQFLYLADPSVEIWDGTVYVYCSHDVDYASTDTKYQHMQDYALLSSTDMVNWTNHEVIFEPRKQAEFSFVLDSEYGGADAPQMNAPDAVRGKDGRYYFYFPYNKIYVGVAVSDNPWGPWEPAMTGYLAYLFDPTVIQDDDGQFYIYGNSAIDSYKGVCGAKLNDDMISLGSDWMKLTSESVNEAVHVFKRDSIYHFTGRIDKATGYWTSTSPLPTADSETGYATYQGKITMDQGDAPAHMSFIEFEDNWYIFYHRGDGVNDGNYWRRSACFDPVTFNDEGIMNYIDFSLGDDTYTGAGTTTYPESGITTYTLDTLLTMLTSETPVFPEGNTWYIETSRIMTVENGSGYDKAEQIIEAATAAGCGNGSITLDFSYSTLESFSSFCPIISSGTDADYDENFNALGGLTGLGSVESIGAWTFRQAQYLRTIDNLANVTGTLDNYCFYSLPALDSLTIGISGFASTSKASFYGCTSLVYLDMPNATSFGSAHFNKMAPKTMRLTSEDEITFSVSSGFTSSGCDLYLSATNYASVTTGSVSWGGKTWKSITNVTDNSYCGSPSYLDPDADPDPDTDTNTGTTYYPETGITTYTIDTLHLMATDTTGLQSFPEGNVWYIEDDTYEKVDGSIGEGNDKIDEIIIAATASGKYGNGEITLDFSYSTFTTLDQAFCPLITGQGTVSDYFEDYNALGGITGLDRITTIVAWSFRNMQYLKTISGLDNVVTISGNYNFNYLPALDSLSFAKLTTIACTKGSFLGLTSLEYVNMPSVTTVASPAKHFANAAPNTFILTAESELTSFLQVSSFTSTGCDLYLSETNYAIADTTALTWGGKTWQSINCGEPDGTDTETDKDDDDADAGIPDGITVYTFAELDSMATAATPSFPEGLTWYIADDTFGADEDALLETVLAATVAAGTYEDGSLTLDFQYSTFETLTTAFCPSTHSKHNKKIDPDYAKLGVIKGLDKVTEVINSSFTNMGNVKTIEGLDNVTIFSGSYHFIGMTLGTLSLKNVTEIGAHSFRNATVDTLKLDSYVNLAQNAVGAGTSINYLYTPNVTTRTVTNAFTGTATWELTTDTEIKTDTTVMINNKLTLITFAEGCATESCDLILSGTNYANAVNTDGVITWAGSVWKSITNNDTGASMGDVPVPESDEVPLVGTYYEDLGITTYSIDALNASVTAKIPTFPEGTTWYIEDDTYVKVENGTGNDMIDEIIVAATASGKYANGAITLDFSKSTITSLDQSFCPEPVVEGITEGYDSDFNALGGLTGLDNVTSMLAWSIRNYQYLKTIKGIDKVTGALQNYCFFDLPSVDSLTLGVSSFATSTTSKYSLHNMTSLKYIDMPNLISGGGYHLKNAAPETFKLTTDTLIESFEIGCTTATCDLYLSATNYANAVDTDGVITWGGKTWRSVTNNDDTTQYIGTPGDVTSGQDGGDADGDALVGDVGVADQE